MALVIMVVVMVTVGGWRDQPGRSGRHDPWRLVGEGKQGLALGAAEAAPGKGLLAQEEDDEGEDKAEADDEGERDDGHGVG